MEESRPDITQAFFNFVDQKVKDLDQFYILGDFFEVWIGDDFQDPFIESVKDCLKDISRRVPECFFQHGNRDFLIGQEFSEQTGFQLLPDIHPIPHPQLTVIAMHGDSLCTLDTEYLEVRKFLRSELFIQDAMSKSIEERLVLAQQMRAASTDANSGKTMEIMDVSPEEVIRVMEQYQADLLIHGHTHRPQVHALETAHNQQAQRMVMSDWESTIQYIEMDEQGARLLNFEKYA